MGARRSGWRWAAALAVVLTMSACQRAHVGPAPTGTAAVDDATVLTMWTRSLTGAFSRALIDEYNRTHRNKVKLTVMPADSYQQRVGAAAGTRQLPDLLAIDVVYAPNYASQGVFTDITARVGTLGFREYLAPSHMRAATHAGHVYGVPHDIDLAALFYNKDLFIRAGLDGDKPPANLRELHEFAAKLTALGGGVHGFNFGGACPDCMFATSWPMIWASGSKVLTDDGTAALLNSPDATQVFELYRRMYAEGLAPRAARNESGPSWTQAFSEGLVGIQPMGATALRNIEEASQLQVGVAAIPGLEGGASSFLGGDVLGISSNSRHADQAWDFIAWTLSEQAQVEVVAKNRYVTVRSDLDGNVYAQQDPRLVTFTQIARKGQTPYAVAFGKTFNDPNGPWISAVADAVFGTGPVSAALDRHNVSITASLSGG
ncbi:sugar ABC transporter substrate-binding protein [Dactylosporangium sp. NBC_01737]|uniref:ABC transporter substrate-binding protein n=1 Tax=Dactylosporangium sp. NBC_01737 TaxID=2975959 RepID=UPI002E0F9D45|nr:sugar ABC transporter substrate-binding protein [Dactylosporangium sp. NBC_01737]